VSRRAQQAQAQAQLQWLSTESKSKSESESKSETKEKKSSLRDTIHKMKAESGDGSSESAGTSNFGGNPAVQAAMAQLDIFRQGISSTWQDLLESGRPKDINKKLRPEQPAHSDGDTPEDDNEAADKYTGSTAIMILDENDREMTAWDRMQKRLSEAPVIQGT
jgi:hypothetical protein